MCPSYTIVRDGDEGRAVAHFTSPAPAQTASELRRLDLMQRAREADAVPGSGLRSDQADLLDTYNKLIPTPLTLDGDMVPNTPEGRLADALREVISPQKPDPPQLTSVTGESPEEAAVTNRSTQNVVTSHADISKVAGGVDSAQLVTTAEVYTTPGNLSGVAVQDGTTGMQRNVLLDAQRVLAQPSGDGRSALSATGPTTATEAQIAQTAGDLPEAHQANVDAAVAGDLTLSTEGARTQGAQMGTEPAPAQGEGGKPETEPTPSTAALAEPKATPEKASGFDPKDPEAVTLDNLPGALASVMDPKVVKQARKNDSRVGAAPIYDARENEMESWPKEGTDSGKADCPHCGFRAATPHGLTVHVRAKHPGKPA